MLRYGLPALVIGALCIACAGDARAAVSRDQPDNAGIEPLRREVQAHSTWIGGYAVQCAAILAATGWQTVHFRYPVNAVMSIGGAWTASRRLPPAGPRGHVQAGEWAQSARRIDPRLPLGALLARGVGVDSGTGRYREISLNVDGPGRFLVYLDMIDMRINEDDSALADNSGALDVCFLTIDP